jgi:predicted nucleic acid-binding protein
MKVFADSYFYVALLNPRDEAHALACELAAEITAVVTTQWVLTEVADGFCRVVDRPRVERLIASFAETKTELVMLNSRVFDRAVQLYLARPDKGWSLTDCTSFVVMKDHGLRQALTGDRHFEQAGFEILM